MLHKMISHFPPSIVRKIGRMQFYPVLGRFIRQLANKYAQREGIIARGLGAGLRFDGRGGYPGYLLGTSEPEEQAAIIQYLHVGGVLYDVGANIGHYTTLGARIVGPTGHVYAFEPFDVSVQAIRKNAAINGFEERVTIVESAVSDHEGVVDFLLKGSSAEFKIASSGNEHCGASRITVSCTSIDTFRETRLARDPTLVLLDVEGAEVDVLRGMIKTITACRPTILVEVHWIQEEFERLVNEELEPLGYRVTKLDGSPLPTDPLRYHALLLPKDCVV